ncbi:hypothetical protein N7452_010427 [Penicillium brevicompactum]|uniref:Uncharacterized protein n=1 Tax=Penicillium brevicompactum TaxID=5074 RepID=A0A9W9QFE6_PENBR|nr:hypothetical protein N7452_010427 [Penicillium brevicompactum]
MKRASEQIPRLDRTVSMGLPDWGEIMDMRSSKDHLWMDESAAEIALRLIRANTRAEQQVGELPYHKAEKAFEQS